MKKFISVLAAFVLCAMLSVPVMASESPEATTGDASLTPTPTLSPDSVSSTESSPRTSDTIVVPGLATIGVAGIGLTTVAIKKKQA